MEGENGEREEHNPIAEFMTERKLIVTLFSLGSLGFSLELLEKPREMGEGRIQTGRDQAKRCPQNRIFGIIVYKGQMMCVVWGVS